jgi:hypothetical protein
MRLLRAGLAYFASVFSVGFALGAIRVPFLVPRLGERVAELVELPFMVAASYFLARWVVRRFGPFTMGERLGIGVVALALLLVAELGVVLLLQGQSLRQYAATRDPVSGTAYVFALVAFAFMPLIAGRIQHKGT